MRLLFEIDTKDYDPNGKAFVRPSVRGIIIRGGKVAMVERRKDDTMSMDAPFMVAMEGNDYYYLRYPE